jgi:hypothetical protein
MAGHRPDRAGEFESRPPDGSVEAGFSGQKPARHDRMLDVQCGSIG